MIYGRMHGLLRDHYRQFGRYRSMDPKCTGRELSLDELRSIVAPIAKKHGMLRVHLFGSRARGDNRAGSDYDFCVLAPKGYGLFKIGSFLSDLEDALKADVDIVSEDALYKNRHFSVTERSCPKHDIGNLRAIIRRRNAKGTRAWARSTTR
jgi:predicted nucleotidyltransferase